MINIDSYTIGNHDIRFNDTNVVLLQGKNFKDMDFKKKSMGTWIKGKDFKFSEDLFLPLNEILNGERIRKAKFSNLFESLTHFIDLNDFFRNFPSNFCYFKNLVNDLELIFELSNLIIKRESLSHELDLAKLADKNNVEVNYSNRIDYFKNKINIKKKEFAKISMLYHELKDEIETSTSKMDMIKDEISLLNKEYMNISRQTNKISRDLDETTRKDHIYMEKLKEINILKTKEADNHVSNDYQRVLTKHEVVLSEIVELNEKKKMLNNSIKDLKNQILSKRQNLNLLKKKIEKEFPKYEKITQDYKLLNSELDEYESNLSDTIKLINSKIIKDEEPDYNFLIEKPSPDFIRFSDIIEHDISETDFKMRNLMKLKQVDFLKQKPIDFFIKFVNDVDEELNNFTKKRVDSLPRVNILNILQIWFNFLSKLETNVNKLLSPLKLNAKFASVPLFFPEQQQEIMAFNHVECGIKASIFDIKEMKLSSSELSIQKKLFMIFAFEIGFNKANDEIISIFHHEDFDSKYVTKKNLKEVLQNYNKILREFGDLKDQKIIYLLPQSKFSDKDKPKFIIINL